MKTIFLNLFLSLISLGLFAQNFEVPQNYTLDKAEDYAPYEQDVINCVNWLIETPLNEQLAKRNEANAFLITWLSGSPNVTVVINEAIVPFMETSPELLVVFLGGWAKYALENGDSDSNVDACLAGIEAVIRVYEANNDILQKDKNIKKFIKMQKKGTLKEYVQENIQVV